MFTGIIEEIGTIQSIRRGSHSAELLIGAKEILRDVKVGDSIAVNGICLTVTAFSKSNFSADVMHETLNRTALAASSVNSKVNLERAMPINGRFGGHIVAGHVDGVGKITDIKKDDNAIWYTIFAEQTVLRYIVEKGSVAIDGISLTVAKTDNETFSISAIPHTVEKTTLSARKKGDAVNLETDIIGKYVEKLMQPAEKAKPQITRELLNRYGF